MGASTSEGASSVGGSSGFEKAMAIGSFAFPLATTVMSFIGAGEQKRKQREAERAAERAMAEVRKQLSVNYFDEVAIKKEPYELQREALLSQGAMAIQAGVESERGGATTAGKVQMAQNEAQAGIRTAMGQEMNAIEQQSIEEKSRLRDLNAQLTLGEIEGQQQRAADAEQAAAAANQQGFEDLTNTLQTGLSMVPLFMKKEKNNFNNKAVMPTTMAAAPGESYGTIPTRPMPNQGQLTGASGYVNPLSGYYPGMPQPGSQYGMFGTDFSGVGG